MPVTGLRDIPVGNRSTDDVTAGLPSVDRRPRAHQQGVAPLAAPRAPGPHHGA